METGVTAKKLVTPQTRERDFDSVPSNRPRNDVGVNRVYRRQIEMVNRFSNRFNDFGFP
jgi:hypothetical protein